MKHGNSRDLEIKREEPIEGKCLLLGCQPACQWNMDKERKWNIYDLHRIKGKEAKAFS